MAVTTVALPQRPSCVQDRSLTLAALVAAKEAEAAAVREQLSRAPLGRSQSTGMGVNIPCDGHAHPLSGAASLPQPLGQETRLPPCPGVVAKVCCGLPCPRPRDQQPWFRMFDPRLLPPACALQMRIPARQAPQSTCHTPHRCKSSRHLSCEHRVVAGQCDMSKHCLQAEVVEKQRERQPDAETAWRHLCVSTAALQAFISEHSLCCTTDTGAGIACVPPQSSSCVHRFSSAQPAT